MAGKINITYDEIDIMNLILEDLRRTLPTQEFKQHMIDIKVQSRQNYRERTWEAGKIQVTVDTSKINIGAGILNRRDE